MANLVDKNHSKLNRNLSQFLDLKISKHNNFFFGFNVYFLKNIRAK